MTHPPGGPAAGDIAPAGHRAPATPAVLQVASLAELTRLAGNYLPEEDLQRIREAYRFSDASSRISPRISAGCRRAPT